MSRRARGLSSSFALLGPLVRPLVVHLLGALLAPLVVATSSSGCGSGEPAPPSSSAPSREDGIPGGGAPVPPPRLPSSRPSRFEPRAEPLPSPESLPPAPVATETETVVAEREPVDAGRPRDLGAELAQAVGSVDGCLDADTARSLHGELSIGLSASVTPVGRVTRGSVSAPSLPPAAVACLERRLLDAHLAGPIPDAPRSVSTTLRFAVSATAPQTQRSGPFLVWNPLQPGLEVPGPNHH